MPSGTAVRVNAIRKWLAAGVAAAAIGGYGVWAQDAGPEAAFLIGDGRFGDLVTLGEHLDEVAARFGPLSPMPIPFAGFKMYPVPSTPPLLITACDGTGTVNQAILQQSGPDTSGFQTAAGIGLGASEADVVAAYGEPEERRPWFDGFELVYPRLGFVFGFDGPHQRVASLGIFLGTFMRCP